MNNKILHLKKEYQLQFEKTLKLSEREALFEINQILKFVSHKKNINFLYEKDFFNLRIEKEISRLLDKRISGIPLAIIFKEWDFYGRTFYVTKSTLIPRPETEQLIDEIKNDYKNKTNLKFADLGCGTGNIGITLALELMPKEIILIDKSKRALRVTTKNIKRYQIKNVQVIESNWFNNLPKQKFDFIVSNPPYIKPNDPHLKFLSHEPKSALISKSDGLLDISHIASKSKNFLKKNGYLYIEHGYNQAKDVRDIFLKNHFQNIETFKDLSGNDRITKGKY
jgi:release factor glutamine methyltransferase